MTETESERGRRPDVPLAPHLICKGAAEAIAFYEQAFGAEEMIRVPGRDGKLMHAAVMINGAMVMLVDENADMDMRGPASLGGTPVTIHLNVLDVDAAVERALGAGATLVMPVADQFWGDRFGMIRDPFGHSWSLATHQRDVSLEELQAAANHAACG
jgi:uncharacterized glyoxalase superfamily protein PhnB